MWNKLVNFDPSDLFNAIYDYWMLGLFLTIVLPFLVIGVILVGPIILVGYIASKLFETFYTGRL
jgi:hypothetical protein